jgi:dihydrolipoyl dehydrogenase
MIRHPFKGDFGIMAKKVVVIGAGPGGYVAAVRAAQMGGDVTVVERDQVGGTCLNWGCIPSKVMKTTADMLDRFRRSAEFGVAVAGDFRPDMNRVMARKTRIIETQAKGILSLLKHHGIRLLKGGGTVSGVNSVSVKGEDGSLTELPWDRLILATGSRPLGIPLCPFDGKKIISSNEALNLYQVPASLLIVGGGVVGCEFAFILSSFGARVTLVEAMPRILPLPSVDEDCAKILQREMKKRKIDVQVNRTVERFEDRGGKLRFVIGASPFLAASEKEKIKQTTVDAELALVCIGRQSNTTAMGLQDLGIRMDDRGWILVDERMETSLPGVYAIGDGLGPSKIMLAHVASTEGWIAAENAMGSDRVMDYDVVPGAIFTEPEVANVGLTENQAKQNGYPVRSDSVLFRSLGKSHVVGDIAGQTKIISNTETGRILGVHIVGPHATELIAEATLAIRMGATVQDLTATIHAHPTLSEIMLEASFKAANRPLHG